MDSFDTSKPFTFVDEASPERYAVNATTIFENLDREVSTVSEWNYDSGVQKSPASGSRGQEIGVK